MFRPLSQTCFQGNFAILKSGIPEKEEIETSKAFFKTYVLKASKTFESFIPIIEKSDNDLYISHSGQSIRRYNASRYLVAVVPHQKNKRLLI